MCMRISAANILKQAGVVIIGFNTHAVMRVAVCVAVRMLAKSVLLKDHLSCPQQMKTKKLCSHYAMLAVAIDSGARNTYQKNDKLSVMDPCTAHQII